MSRWCELLSFSMKSEPMADLARFFLAKGLNGAPISR